MEYQGEAREATGKGDGAVCHGIDEEVFSDGGRRDCRAPVKGEVD